MTAILKITDGVQSVNLIGGAFHLVEWRPSGAEFKSDGYWQDPSLSDGRRLNQYSMSNWTESMTLAQGSVSQDAAIRQVNKLARLLLDAAEFSVHPKHGRRPVYLEVKASKETNTRYAYIHAGHVGEYGNPFSQPFLQSGCRASVENINITLERGPWLEAPPATDVCQPIQPTGKPVGATFYEYDDVILGTQPPIITWPAFALWKLNETSGTTAANSSVHTGLNGTYAAQAENLIFWNGVDRSNFLAISAGEVDIYSTALNTRFSGLEGSALAWVNTSGPIWTGGNEAYFLNIQVDANNYLRIYHPGPIINNSVQWEYKSGGTTVSYRYDDFSPDNEWFSVGMTWSLSQLGFPNIRFYLNGSLVATRQASVSWAGNLAATLNTIGASDNTGSDGAASDMAYVALWSAPLTDQDMAIVGVPSDGFLTDASDLDCDSIVAYVGNKRNMAKLTHVWHYDNSATTFSGNLLATTPPYNLSPNPSAAQDQLIFGIQTTTGSGLPDGPFNSLVFDIATAALAATSYVVVWEYWASIAWVTIPDYVDNTNGLQEAGINSVHWPQPSNWTTTTLNGVTGYFVRMRITTLTGAFTIPVAQDYPYTIAGNTVTIPEDNVGGSLPATARISWYNQTDAFISRVVMGLRSHDIAPNFTSILNVSDEQNPPGVTVAVVNGDASFITDLTSATGRAINLTYAVGSANLTDIFRITLDSSLADSFLGSYKVFVIYQVNALATASTQFSWRIGTRFTDIDTGGYIDSVNNHTVHEVGEVTIRPDSFIGDSVDSLVLEWRSTVTSGLNVDFYGVVMIPTDEWFGDFGNGGGDVISSTRYLSVDGTRYMNRTLVAEARDANTDASASRFKQSHNGPPIILPSGRQIFHFLFMTDDAGNDVEADPWIAGTVKFYRNRRYHYGRGDE